MLHFRMRKWRDIQLIHKIKQHQVVYVNITYGELDNGEMSSSDQLDVLMKFGDNDLEAINLYDSDCGDN